MSLLIIIFKSKFVKIIEVVVIREQLRHLSKNKIQNLSRNKKGNIMGREYTSSRLKCSEIIKKK